MLRRSRSTNSLVASEYKGKDGSKNNNEALPSKSNMRRIPSSHLISIEEARVGPNLDSKQYNSGKTKRKSSSVRSILLSMKCYHIFVVVTCLFMLGAIVAGVNLMLHFAGNSFGYGNLSSLYTSEGYYKHFGGAVNEGYFKIKDSVSVNTAGVKSFSFVTVTDLDQLSRIAGEKPMFRALLLPGILKTSDDGKSYSISFQSARELVAGQNEAGRGMELSELTIYQNRLFTFDDRTGAVFEIINKIGGLKSDVIPRFIITEGDGETSKGKFLGVSFVGSSILTEL